MAVDADLERTDPSMPEAAQQGFVLLRRQFTEGLPGRLREIRSALDAQERHQALHRLVGAAGSYGFGSLSQAARAADVLTGAADSVAHQGAWAALLECVALACAPVGPARSGGAPSRTGDTKP